MKIVINQKSNLLKSEVDEYLDKLKSLDSDKLIIGPSSCYLPFFSSYNLLAQDISPYEMGAYTGAVAGEMLKSLGVSYVLINHSERLKYFNEDLIIAKKKLKQAINSGITPIICVGENNNEDVTNSIKMMLDYLLEDLKVDDYLIAYEPFYAIGTGNTPSISKVEEVVDFLTNTYQKKVLYGGSVNQENIRGFKNIKNLAGFLLGTASLDVDILREIVKEI